MALPLGFEFEESVFEGGCRERKGRPSLPPAYSPRRCEPQWFCEERNCEDAAESVNIKKFRGDLAYKQKEFKNAACEYSGCLALLPLSNVAMRRDVQESHARCLAHLGRHKEALEIAETLQTGKETYLEGDHLLFNVQTWIHRLFLPHKPLLRNGATNTDHVTAVLGLQLAIYSTLERIEKIIGCLQQLISLHPFHPGDWKSLAETYVSCLQSPAPVSLSEADLLQCGGLGLENCLKVSSNESGFQCCRKHSWRKDFSLQFSPRTNNGFGTCEEGQRENRPTRALGKSEIRHTTMFDSMGEEGSRDVWIYACASFVRARLLFQLMQSNQSSFALESNLKAQQEIEDKITSLGLKGDVLSLMTSAMGEDLVPEKLKEDIQGEVKCLSASALTSLMTASTVAFEQKWFQKLRGRLSHLDCCT